MTIGKAALALVFIGGGIMHFVAPAAYLRIVPSILPDPLLLVQITGVCEILGGVGLLVPAAQKFAAWGLIALLVAVLPANINMAIHHELFPKIPLWALWFRVPLQLPLILWAWLYTRR